MLNEGVVADIGAYDELVGQNDELKIMLENLN